MKIEILSRVDSSGAVTQSQKGFLKGEASSIEEALEIIKNIPGGYIRNESGAILAPDGSWIMTQQTITLPVWTCLRCGHVWTGRQDKAPVSCARCRSIYWNKPRQVKGHKEAK